MTKKTDRIQVESDNHAVTLGRYCINRDPLYVLKDLAASIGWMGGRTCIVLSEARHREIHECIAFNEGKEFNVSKYDK